MNRRQFLATGTIAGVASIAGCFGGDEDDPDGYGPEPESMPDERSIETSEYETENFGGIDVPLAPLDDVVYWYRRQESRMVDTRGTDQHDAIRITGSVLSSAPDGVTNDPVEEWSQDDLIVTYCVCPHTLAGQRAATLIDSGYENVYALDEGLQAWINAGYEIEGTEAGQALSTYDISGLSDPEYAGEYVHARTLESDQSEVSAVESDGSYELTLHFADVDSDSLLEIDAPDYTRELTLEEATSTEITA
ncbi:rhodanese-like domain-containing protein [Natrialbaceae archaeon A-arb3/5]